MTVDGNPSFQINDYIFHGGSGVCVVEDICVPKHMQNIDSTRKYYRLHPLYEANSVIYTPVDGRQSNMRKILGREDVLALIEQLPSLEPLDIDDEKAREETYRTALRTNLCSEWMRVIKTIHLRNDARKLEGKRLCQADERYLQMAETLLYGELAVPLGIDREQVQSYIRSCLPQTEDAQEFQVEHPA